MRYRNEWKYICTNKDMIVIENNLSGILELDKNADSNGTYSIHSLYFDDYSNNSLFENDAGIGERSKWRIRYYNNNLDFLMLEKKEKKCGLCRKKVTPISRKDYDAIINGEVYETVYNTKNKLLQLFCIEILTKKLEPKIIVEYVRKAYVEPISNVRITFDMNISVSSDVYSFLGGDHICIPLLSKDKLIYEVKFDDILPSTIKKSAYVNELNQTTFSKYYLCRKIAGY